MDERRGDHAVARKSEGGLATTQFGRDTPQLALGGFI